MDAVVTQIRMPPKARIARAGLSIVRHDALWWVVPTHNPRNRTGDGFRLKSEAQKAALEVSNLVGRST